MDKCTNVGCFKITKSFTYCPESTWKYIYIRYKIVWSDKENVLSYRDDTGLCMVFVGFNFVLNLSQNKTNFLLQMYGLRAVLVC